MGALLSVVVFVKPVQTRENIEEEDAEKYLELKINWQRETKISTETSQDNIQRLLLPKEKLRRPNREQKASNCLV